MKCLAEDCNNEIVNKTGRRKFCSDSCKMKHFRKHGKKNVATKFDVQVLLNEIKSVVQDFAGKVNYGVVPTILDAPRVTDLIRDELPQYSEPTPMQKPKSVVKYIQERLECENAEDYDNWLSNLENDPYLSKRDKQSAKTGTL
jgi:hypothetical protein